LIQFVRSGDTIFHFDRACKAIVAHSTSTGRARRCTLAWSKPARFAHLNPAVAEPMPSWSVDLEPASALDDVLTIAQIARLQSELFPDLRDLEDAVGAPIYYPFEMGSEAGTHLLAGQVFKIPALFVAACPALARAAGPVSGVGRAASTHPSRCLPVPCRSPRARGSRSDACGQAPRRGGSALS
jgi:hypothetical protein